MDDSKVLEFTLEAMEKKTKRKKLTVDTSVSRYLSPLARRRERASIIKIMVRRS